MAAITCLSGLITVRVVLGRTVSVRKCSEALCNPAGAPGSSTVMVGQQGLLLPIVVYFGYADRVVSGLLVHVCSGQAE